jgi:hypothetical protein
MITIIYEKQECSFFGETIQIKKLKALPYGKLPREYTKESPSFWCDMHFLSKRTVFERHPVEKGGSKYLLIEGETYTKEEFTKRMKYIAQAGERLSFVNRVSELEDYLDRMIQGFIDRPMFYKVPDTEQSIEEPEWFKDMMKVPIQYEDESPVQVNVHKWQGGKTIKL